MKRWLIVVSLLVAGLLMVGWGGDALAARHPPSLLQKILAMFTPNKSLETVQAPPSVESMRPVETAPAAYALQGVERAEPAQAAPAAGPEPSYDQRKEGRSPQADTTRSNGLRGQGDRVCSAEARSREDVGARLAGFRTGSSHQACDSNRHNTHDGRARSGKARDREGAAGSGGHPPNPCDQEAGQGTTRRNRAIGAGDTAGKGRYPGGHRT
jgi:hypothetical protein